MKKKSGRVVVLDLLRGFFMFGIIVNHLALFPNLLVVLTGATKLWVSFAEGFFMVSGILLGMLNRDKIEVSFRGVFKKSIQRSLWLYVWATYLTLLFTLWGNLLPHDLVKTGLWEITKENWPLLIGKTLTLQYTYGWADILPYYAVFLLAAPFYLWVLSNGGVIFVLIANLLIWLFRGDNVYLAIQSLFFLGMVLGFYSREIQTRWESWDIKRRMRIKWLTYGVFVLSLVTSLISVFFFDKIAAAFNFPEILISKNRVLNWYFDKQTVGIGRVLLSPIWLLAGLFLFANFSKKIEAMFGWLFYTLGTNSLYAYIWHAIVIYPVPFLIYKLNLYGVWWNTTISLLAVILVYILSWGTLKGMKYVFDK